MMSLKAERRIEGTLNRREFFQIKLKCEQQIEIYRMLDYELLQALHKCEVYKHALYSCEMLTKQIIISAEASLNRRNWRRVSPTTLQAGSRFVSFLRRR